MSEIYGQVKSSEAENFEHEGSLSAKRMVEIPSNMKKRFQYDGSNNAIYIGYAPTGLAEGTNGWLLWQLTWTGSNCTAIDIAYGNWTNRASYTYG